MKSEKVIEDKIQEIELCRITGDISYYTYLAWKDALDLVLDHD